jgi:hypothetical protein
MISLVIAQAIIDRLIFSVIKLLIKYGLILFCDSLVF